MLRTGYFTGMLSGLRTDNAQHRVSAQTPWPSPTHVPAPHDLKHQVLAGQEPSSRGMALGWWRLPAHRLPGRNLQEAANEHRSMKLRGE